MCRPNIVQAIQRVVIGRLRLDRRQELIHKFGRRRNAGFAPHVCFHAHDLKPGRQIFHADDARKNHVLDVAARPTNLAISVVNLAAGLGCEVANLTSLPALRLTLFLTSPETDHVSARDRLAAGEHNLVAALGLAPINTTVLVGLNPDVLVPENFQEIARTRMQQLIVAKTDARARMFQKGRGPCAVGIEDPKRTLAVEHRRAVRPGFDGLKRANLVDAKVDLSAVVQARDQMHIEGVGRACAMGRVAIANMQS